VKSSHGHSRLRNPVPDGVIRDMVECEVSPADLPPNGIMVHRRAAQACPALGSEPLLLPKAPFFLTFTGRHNLQPLLTGINSFGAIRRYSI
jgi:hypothetical protein